MPTQTRSRSLGLTAHDAIPDAHSHSVDDLHSVWGHHNHNHNHNHHHQHRLHGEADEEPTVSSSSSFSSAVRRNETTPAKRRHAGSDATPRRARNDHDPWAEPRDGPGETAAHSHARARTLDGDVGRGTSTSHHPLKSGSGSGSGSSSSEGGLVHNTRPTMRRLLSLDEDAGETRGRSHEWEREREGEASLGKEREMLVIVHEVQPTDSLAGVALKYGISLADLRRANQLWPSDPIHLRDTLYIPIDKARHMKHLVLDALQNGEVPPHCSDAADHLDASASQSASQSRSEQAGKYTLRRVPASQLSFFPPPNQSSPPRVHANGGQPPPPSFNMGMGAQSRTMPSRKPTSRRPALPVSFSRSQDAGGAPLQNVLDLFSTSLHATAHQLRTYAQSQSALFAAAAAFPTKPTTSAVGAAAAVARLSIDSNSATASSASEDVDWEHEMEDIGTSGSGSGSGRRQTQRGHGQARRSRSYSTSRKGVMDGATLRARKPRGLDPDERESVELDSVPFGSANGASGREGRRRGSWSSQSQSQARASAHPRTRWASEGSGAGANGHPKRVVPYIADAVDERDRHVDGVVVRTAQLEPSPGMQLPSLQRRRPSVREGES
ncbi:hypothetical protein C8Q73DRAFT_795474 [Cubamyces lactineus]|nr:hypothetical protein C8Q73DRAFT_795474 [Cubamyces lactineus]